MRISGQIVQKCSQEITEKMILEIDQTAPQIRFVSRSAQKLDDFLKQFHISVSGAKSLDIGAST